MKSKRNTTLATWLIVLTILTGAASIWTSTAQAESGLILETRGGTLILLDQPCLIPNTTGYGGAFMEDTGRVMFTCWRVISEKTIFVQYEDNDTYVYPIQAFQLHHTDQ